MLKTISKGGKLERICGVTGRFYSWKGHLYV